MSAPSRLSGSADSVRPTGQTGAPFLHERRGVVGTHFEEVDKFRHLFPQILLQKKEGPVPSEICFRSPVTFRSPSDRLTMRRQQAEDALSVTVAANAEKDAKMMRMSQKSKQAMEAASEKPNEMKVELNATRLELQKTQVCVARLCIRLAASVLLATTQR